MNDMGSSTNLSNIAVSEVEFRQSQNGDPVLRSRHPQCIIIGPSGQQHQHRYLPTVILTLGLLLKSG